MNWPKSYHDRLQAWLDLRACCQNLELEPMIRAINAWWQQAPWRPYYLHWDDRTDWPDPWQLLVDNVFCDLARALGALYTVRLLDRNDCADAVLVETDLGNLVLVAEGKYIMNWNQEHSVNIPSKQLNILRTLEPEVLAHLIR